MSNNHYIYLLYDKNQIRYFSNEVQKNGRKIGSTCNIVMRMKPYLTGHPDKVPLECYYKILNPELYTCYEIDNMIKKEFNEYNLKGSGGIEFYEVNKVTQDILEKYFDTMNILYEKCFDIIDENIHTITKKDIEDLTYDIVKHNYKITDKYNLLKQYIEKIKERDIIKELLKTNDNIFDYLLQNYDDKDINYLKENLIDDQIEVLLSSILYYQYYDNGLQSSLSGLQTSSLSDKSSFSGLQPSSLSDKSSVNGIWNLFCRYGKTRLSCLFSKMQKYKKILILVPSLYLINQTYKTWKTFFNKSNIKKICCEENNNKIDNINTFYYQNDTCIFISTYHSSEKLEHLNFDICIYDEAHRTAGSKIKENSKDEQSFFKKQLENKNIKNKIFLTATTREYIGGEDDYYTMDDENIYGKIIAVVSAKRAKELKRICNYNIITVELKPLVININIEQFFKENNITDQKQKDNLNALKDKYVMCAFGLYKTMEKNNIKHVITFHELIINCKFFKSICQKICKHYYINYIDGSTPNKKNNNDSDSDDSDDDSDDDTFSNLLSTRQGIINQFQKREKSILCSAKVLQEGVDIPKCDGIIFIDIKTSIIDTIQSLSRCLTRIDNYPEKIGNIMIPYDDKTDLLNDQYTNNLRLVLRNIVEIDDNLKEFFKEILKFDFDSSGNNSPEFLEELKIEYNVHVNSKIIKELREISYVTYYQAKKLINGKYIYENDYKMNVENDFKDTDYKLPIDANIIYKSFGWKSWNDFLGLENEMSIKYYTFNNFTKCLKHNNIYDEISYNKLKETNDLLVSLGDIQIKYPKFCFRDIHPNNKNYYWNKQEALDAYKICNNKLIKKIGRDNYSELTNSEIIQKYNSIDNKIPLVNLDIYYPNNN